MMKIRDQKVWDAYVDINNDDEGGMLALKFAQEWAELMESKLIGDKKLSEVVESTAVEMLDRMEISEEVQRFLVCGSIKVLYDVWEYGAPLRVWYENELDRE